MTCTIYNPNPWLLILMIVFVYITNDSQNLECHIKLMEKYPNQ